MYLISIVIGFYIIGLYTLAARIMKFLLDDGISAEFVTSVHVYCPMSQPNQVNIMLPVSIHPEHEVIDIK